MSSFAEEECTTKGNSCVDLNKEPENLQSSILMESESNNEDFSSHADKSKAQSPSSADVSVSNLKKKYGKFRILSDDQQLGETSDSGHSVDTQKFCENEIKRSSDPFIPPTLNTQCELEITDEKGTENDEIEEPEEVVRGRGRPPRRGKRRSKFTVTKRRNAPKQSKNVSIKSKDGQETTEIEVGVNEALNDLNEEDTTKNYEKNENSSELKEESSTTRRRSNRLKVLEDKEKEKDLDDFSLFSENAVTEQQELAIEKEDGPDKKLIEQDQKSKTKRHKEKTRKSDKVSKEDDKNREKKRRGRRRKNEESNDVKQSKSEDQSNCFILPLPLQKCSSNSKGESGPNSAINSDAEGSPKPEKVKSRWRRNSELESGKDLQVLNNLENRSNSSGSNSPAIISNSIEALALAKDVDIPKENEPMPKFEKLSENHYLIEKKKTKFAKEAKRMVCDCLLTKEERNRGLMGCGEDCLNRMLMIECGSRCPLGDHCSNKRFLKKQYSKVQAFKTTKKGWGLRAMQAIPAGAFIMEYVGEVIGPKEFKNRVKKYARENHEHHFFMALKSDEIIDATCRGNITRFVNHSCDPNSETQKWTVNGELRIGFFTFRDVEAGEEITFDYQFQRYGKEAQKCFCESYNCRGYIGANDVTDIEIDLDGSKLNKVKIKEKDEKEDEQTPEDEFEDLSLEGEIEKLKSSGGLRNRKQCLMLARFMVRAEDIANRLKLLQVMRDTQEVAYLRLLIDYHGLQLLWSWMVDLEDIQLKAEILDILKLLPIPNKTMLKDSKVLDVVEKWSKQTHGQAKSEDKKQLTETETNFEKSDTKTDQDLDLIERKEDEAEEKESRYLRNGEFNNKYQIIKKDLKEVERNGMEAQAKITHNIAALSLKLLNQWKDLKEVYRIPRLERQKRHEDEKEADRKALESEERGYKSTFAYVDNKIRVRSVIEERDTAAMLGLRKTTKRPFDPSQKKSYHQEGITPPVNKISREEHRAYYNMELMRKDYEDAMRHYKLQMSQFNNAIQQQMQMGLTQPPMPPPLPPVPPPSIFSFNSTANFSQPPPPTFPFSAPPPFIQSDYVASLDNQLDIAYELSAQSSVTNTYQNELEQAGHTPEGEPMETQEDELIQSEKPIDVSPKRDIRKTLITITSDEHQLLNDTKAVIQTDYGVELVPNDPNQRKNLAINLFDATYPSPGTYFVSGESIYFIPCQYKPAASATANRFDKDSLSLHNIQTVVIEHIPAFLLPSREECDQTLPTNWESAKDKNGYVYYFNRITKRVQWNFPIKEELETVSVLNASILSTKMGEEKNVVISSADSTSTPRIDAGEPIEHKEIKLPEVEGINGDLPETKVPLKLPNAVTQLLSSITAGSFVRRDVTESPSVKMTQSEPEVHEQSVKLTAVNVAPISKAVERRLKEKFKANLSEHIKNCLNPYRRFDCKIGRILCNDDFKFVARKLTHLIMLKEVKYCKSAENLTVSDGVKHKSKEFIRKYMCKYGPFYKPDEKEDMEDREEEEIGRKLSVVDHSRDFVASYQSLDARDENEDTSQSWRNDKNMDSSGDGETPLNGEKTNEVQIAPENEEFTAQDSFAEQVTS